MSGYHVLHALGHNRAIARLVGWPYFAQAKWTAKRPHRARNLCLSLLGTDATRTGPRDGEIARQCGHLYSRRPRSLLARGPKLGPLPPLPCMAVPSFSFRSSSGHQRHRCRAKWRGGRVKMVGTQITTSLCRPSPLTPPKTDTQTISDRQCWHNQS